MTTNGHFDVFCFIFGAIWCVFLAKTTYYVSKMQCFYEENQAIYTKVQTICITSTNPLYLKYKAFVPVIQPLCTTSKGLSEQSKGII